MIRWLFRFLPSAYSSYRCRCRRGRATSFGTGSDRSPTTPRSSDSFGRESDRTCSARRLSVTGKDVAPSRGYPIVPFCVHRIFGHGPWAMCDSDEQRLDVFNGILLTAHVDAAFD